MRAILMATTTQPRLPPPGRPFDPMHVLVDRSVVQFLVELLTIQRFTKFDLILDESAEAVEATLGDGSRWGVAIHYHLISDGTQPYARIRTIEGIDSEEPVLLAHADHLVELGIVPLSLDKARFFVKDVSSPISSREWTGWALVRGHDLVSIPASATTDSLFRTWADRADFGLPKDWLEIGNDREILFAQERILNGRFAELPRVGREVEPGVWLSRNVNLHDTVRLVPPVHIAEDCLIGARVHIGPNVSVGRGSVIDEGTHIVHALILPHTYVGRGLELGGVVLDHERARIIEADIDFAPEDPTILGKAASSPIPEVFREWINRLVSLAAFAIIAPFGVFWYLIARIRGERPHLISQDVVKTPAQWNKERWRTHRIWSLVEPTDRDAPIFRDLFGRVWPGLIAVATGKMRLVGQPVRSIDGMRQMVHDSQDWARSARTGLITESMVRLDRDASQEERQIADAYHATSASWRHDLGLFLGYFLRLAGLGRH